MTPEFREQLKQEYEIIKADQEFYAWLKINGLVSYRLEAEKRRGQEYRAIRTLPSKTRRIIKTQIRSFSS